MKYRSFGKSGIRFLKLVSEAGLLAAAGASAGCRFIGCFASRYRPGVNFIDTAAGYGNGRSERIIGQVLRERKERIYISTKTPPLPGDWPPSPYDKAEERYPEKYLRENVEERLKNLGVETVDILLLHTWTRAWNRDPKPLRVLHKMKEEGLIRMVGISTPEHDQNSLVGLMQEGWLDAVQVIYNIFEQEPAAEFLPVAESKGVGVIVRVPFDEGVLGGKYNENTRFSEDVFRSRYFAETGFKGQLNVPDVLNVILKVPVGRCPDCLEIFPLSCGS
jgi:aryl-alcohol dehydrogenase-like predicted oxidoreductase